ncbi:DUF6417 family protein [Streptomyces sp. NPDC007189]|uniref:DUF6417 family protein n=1 Tax=Streptomyces sp. NPDC007189 TaxID=3154315 RepID=UPI003454FA83
MPPIRTASSSGLASRANTTLSSPSSWSASHPIPSHTGTPTRTAKTDARQRIQGYPSCSSRRALRVPPAEGLVQRVRTAHVDRPGKLWSLRLMAEQIASVAYAFYLRTVGSSGTEANRFAREYGALSARSVRRAVCGCPGCLEAGSAVLALAVRAGHACASRCRVASRAYRGRHSSGCVCGAAIR